MGLQHEIDIYTKFINFETMAILKIRKTVGMLASLAVVAACWSCGQSVEDKAEADAREYNERECPTPWENNERVDSVAFHRDTHTYVNYREFNGRIDSAELIRAHRKELREVLVRWVRNSTNYAQYKEAGFNFRFVYRSNKTGDVLLDETVSPKEYGSAQ